MYCIANHYLLIMKYKEFHFVSTGALRASTFVSRSSSWTYPPPSSPSFSSLSSSLGFVMGESLEGVVFQHSLLLQVSELFCCTCGLPHMHDKCFSPIPKQTKLLKKQDVGIWKLMWEIRVGYTSPCTLPNMYVRRELAGMYHIAHMFF